LTRWLYQVLVNLLNTHLEVPVAKSNDMYPNFGPEHLRSRRFDEKEIREIMKLRVSCRGGANPISHESESLIFFLHSELHNTTEQLSRKRCAPPPPPPPPQEQHCSQSMRKGNPQSHKKRRLVGRELFAAGPMTTTGMTAQQGVPGRSSLIPKYVFSCIFIMQTCHQGH